MQTTSAPSTTCTSTPAPYGWIIQSKQEQGYWNNELGWVCVASDASRFDELVPAERLPFIGVPDACCIPFVPGMESFGDD